jgi:hypothetical protein
VGGSRTKTYDYDLFNIETDEYPYPDETFDVVIFAELIEHLAINPVWALAEMHRVLRPGGHVIVTTPNALSLERLDSVVRGRRPNVDQYSPSFGYGARHNREYSTFELACLLDTGFDIETLVARDLQRFPPVRRMARAALRLLLRPFLETSRREHLFLRARKRPVFRWQFPSMLFTEAQCRLVRHPWVEMGVNDTIQCNGGGWDSPEQLPDGSWVRRIRGGPFGGEGASVVVRGVAGRSLVRLELQAETPAADGDTRLRIGVIPPGGTAELMACVFRSEPPGQWVTIDVPLNRPAADGEELIVNVLVGPDQSVRVRRIELA